MNLTETVIGDGSFFAKNSKFEKIEVTFQKYSSVGIDFVDLPLITIGEGTTLAEGVYISAHTFTGSLLIVAPVHIGKNVFVGLSVTIGPGTSIGDDSWIGGRNAFINDQIPAQSHFPNFAWDKGNPDKFEKLEVRLGSK